MSKKQVSEQLRKEAGAMIEITTPCISKMMQNNTLTVEKVEILSLQMAAKHGFCAMMECLLTTGEAHINAFDSIRGNTALHFAVHFGQLAMVKLLIKFGAKIIKNKAELTPLDLARAQHPDIYKYLDAIEKIEHKEVEIAGEGQLDE